MTLPAGTQLGRYEIRSHLGAGGMGEVYLAQDTSLRRPVALKLLPPDLTRDGDRLRRFREEACSASALNHPNIITIYEVGAEGDAHFIATEFIDGLTLRQHAAGGRLPLPKALDIGIQIASALAAAHEAGIVHRDVKPENVMLRGDGYVKVLDFGLAKQTQPAAPSGDLEAPTQRMIETEPGVVMGTVAYMSPEQARGLKVDARTDLWSLGVVLFELVAGRRPFDGATPSDVMAAVLTSDPPRLEDVVPEAPEELRQALRRALAKERDRRYQTAGEMLADLHRLKRRVEAEGEAADTGGRDSRAPAGSAPAEGAATTPVASPAAPEAYAAPSDQSLIQSVEIAHVLFADIVGYSRLPMGEQSRHLRRLQEVVRGTREFRRAQEANQLIRLPTGDGMALVFFGSPEAPALCAAEVARALRAHPELELRMGIHTGPVYRVSDINTNGNVAGGGINIAQRVMDCGDAGHILVSKAAADVLREVGRWADKLHDLGEAEVKHGVRVHLFNLHSGEFGNPEVPQKLLAGRASDVAAAGAASGPAARQPSSAEYLIGGVRRHKRGVFYAAALLALATLLAAAFVARQLLRPGGSPAAPSQAMKITRLTSTGKADQAAISPDGKYVVHVVNEGGRQSLRVRQINVASGEQEIVPPVGFRYAGLTFSRDSESIYYAVSERNTAQTSLYQVPILGGTSRKIASDVNSAITFSPDGRRIAFIRGIASRGEQALVVANADGTGQRNVAVRKFPNFFASVSWSPDGKTLACGVGSYVPSYQSYVVEMPADGGPENQLSKQTWFSIRQVLWLQDGSGLILNASEPDATSTESGQIWHLTRADGSVRRVTTDFNDYSSVSVTADSTRLVAVQSETTSNIWLIGGGDANQSSQIGSGVGGVDGEEGVAWTPDGRIIYVSKGGAEDDIWVAGPDGSGRNQLTSNSGANNNPSACPDGRYVVFTSTRTGAPHIWRMNLDGTDHKQLTSGSGENYAQCSPDGRWVVYTLFAGGASLWRVPIDGGAPMPLTEQTTSSPSISPDGRTIAAVYRGEDQNSSARLALMPFDGGEVTKTFEAPGPDWGSIRWSPDGRALNYIVTTGGVSNIWSQPLAGGEPRPITDFQTYRMFSFDWSRDGRRIACSRGSVTNDVVLISNFR
jgi:Tol biopolymer transport system component/class 3 adenylate cyclase